VVTLLANRAQVHLKLGNAADALRDSAAVLTLRPEHAKAWYRYISALKQLKCSKSAQRAQEVADARNEKSDAAQHHRSGATWLVAGLQVMIRT
jgi:hypothetical protein